MNVMEGLWVFDRAATGGLIWAGGGFSVQGDDESEWYTFLRVEKIKPVARFGGAAAMLRLIA